MQNSPVQASVRPGVDDGRFRKSITKTARVFPEFEFSPSTKRLLPNGRNQCPMDEVRRAGCC